MSELVSLTKDGDVAIITVNNPPVNALSPGVPQGIAESVEKAVADDSVKAMILIGGGGSFIAGADINQFEKMRSGDGQGDPVGMHGWLNAMEDSPKPIVSAISGVAFGGGLEVAMATHYRVATPTARVGQPEVKLGIIPGAAGTQRLPRLAGVMKAVEMCATGDPVKSQDALDLGIIDKIIEGDLQEGAVAFARELIAKGDAPRKTRDLTDKLGDKETNAQIFAMARQMAEKQAKGMLAPLKAIDAVEGATTMPFDEGTAYEAKLFAECLASPQSNSLIHLFFSERGVSKVPDVPKDTPKREIKKAAIIGGGTMGGGIAMCYANAGIPVVLKEIKQEFLDRGMKIIEGNYARSVSKGRYPQSVMDKRMALIQPTLSYDDIADADIVVEAVFEGMDLKKEVFKEIDAVAKDGAILASNTSTLNIDEIAASTKRPADVIGHHFFSPANVMRLLEIVRGKETAKDVIATSMSLSKKLKKVGVLVGNCHGFVGNRMVGPYSREAQFLVEEGATPQQVDAALETFGMVMGPFRMGDLAGIDVGWRVRDELRKSGGIPEGLRETLVVDKLYEAGRYGQKTQKGWYRYEEGSRKAIPDPEVEAMIEACSKEAGIERRSISDEEIVERCIYALVNEGAAILKEGFALRASDIDIIYIYGYGFPPAHGGPMWYASQIGLKKVYDKICEFEKTHGSQLWKAAPLLEELAGSGKTFDDSDKAA